jgi:hypothetical protein
VGEGRTLIFDVARVPHAKIYRVETKGFLGNQSEKKGAALDFRNPLFFSGRREGI